MSEHNRIVYEGIKSPFNYEIMNFGGELAFAKQLDSDENVIAWTKTHNIIIKYRNSKGGISRYFPDFLVRKKNQNYLDLIEIKGQHLIGGSDIKPKTRAADDWCKQRGMSYRLLECKSQGVNYSFKEIFISRVNTIPLRPGAK